MKTLIAIIVLSLTCHLFAEKPIAYKIGQPLKEAHRKQLKRLSLMGSGGDILTSQDRSKTHVDYREYVSKDGKLSILLRTQLSSDYRKEIITGIIYSNKGARFPSYHAKGMKWIVSKAVVVTSEPWAATIK